MTFAIHGLPDKYVTLWRDENGIEFIKGYENRVLVEYEILHEQLNIMTVNGVSVGQVNIVFQRRMEYHVGNTFLQTFILVCVGYMSFFFDVANFADRIMVTLTTMLVVATIATSIQAVRVINMQ